MLQMVGQVGQNDLQIVPRFSHPAIPAGMAKRAFDLMVATVAFVVVFPLLLVLVLAICLESPGNPIFKQERLGRQGKPFRMLKLRTMVPDAERRRAEVEHLNEALPPLFKCHNDPRVTRFGRFLRTTSLDELPQLINVIRGDMSLVGPRPRLPREFANLTPAISRRLSVKPGLAGIWQVSGRAKLDFDEALELDLQYVEHHNFWVDLKLIARTFLVVLTLRGAY
jgi:lipopolysaccharide/colanic/teichoic acid biosynthesis glycosyltransferase